MSDEAIRKFLAGEPRAQADEKKVEAFIESKPNEKPKEQVITPSSNPVMDYAQGLNNTFLDTLDLPADVFNFAAEKMGASYRMQENAYRELGSSGGVGTPVGEEPDTAGYSAGKLTGMGLEFLVPFLRMGKGAASIAVGTQGKGTTTLVAEQMTKPFISSPKAAYALELAAGGLSGAGGYYGKDAGPYGQIAGELAGGVAPQITMQVTPRVMRYVMDSVLPFTKAGGKERAAGIYQQLAESPEVRAKVEENAKLLERSSGKQGFKLTTAELAEDKHLKALQKVIEDQDPALVEKLKQQDRLNNVIAQTDLGDMKTEAGVPEAQKVLGSKFMQLTTRVNAAIDSSLKNVQGSVEKLTSGQSRKIVNIRVKEKIDKALVAARETEQLVWGEVNKNIMAPTGEARQVLKDIYKGTYKTTDPKDVPPFVRSFLGDMQEGEFVQGSLKAIESVGELHAFRSRLLKVSRKERSKTSPNWPKIKVLGDIEEAVLNDIASTGTGKEFDDAISFSRSLHQKFSGDIMGTIMKHSESGGAMAPELTLDRLGTGPQGAVKIRKILDATPNAKQDIEEVLKLELAHSRILKDGRLNLDKAKQYMIHNEDTMEIFPGLASDIEKAIALEERARWYTVQGKKRLDKAEQSLSYKLSEGNPRTFVNTILDSYEPVKQMKIQLRRLNPVGREGVKNDIIDSILSNSATSATHPDGTPVMSAARALRYWSTNKSTLGIPFNANERNRIDDIIKLMRLNEPTPDLPTDIARQSIKARETVISYVVGVMAARAGAKMGAKTSGASLRTASQASNRAKDILGFLDTNTAKTLIKDSITDVKLFDTLMTDPVKVKPGSKSFQVLQGWMMANVINNLEQKNADDR